MLITGPAFTRWSPQIKIDQVEGTFDSCGNAKVATVGDVAHLVWSRNTMRPYKNEICYRRITGNNPAPMKVIDHSANNLYDPGIASLGSKLLIVWRECQIGPAAVNKICYKYFNGSDWSSKKTIVSSSANLWEPTLAANDKTAFLCWQQEISRDRSVIKYKKFVDGSWGKSIKISAGTGQAMSARVSCYGDDAYFTWTQLDLNSTGNPHKFYGRRMRNSALMTIQMIGSGGSGNSTITKNAILVIWSDDRFTYVRNLSRKSGKWSLANKVALYPAWLNSLCSNGNKAFLDTLKMGKGLYRRTFNGSTWLNPVKIPQDGVTTFFSLDSAAGKKKVWSVWASPGPFSNNIQRVLARHN